MIKGFHPKRKKRKMKVINALTFFDDHPCVIPKGFDFTIARDPNFKPNKSGEVEGVIKFKDVKVDYELINKLEKPKKLSDKEMSELLMKYKDYCEKELLSYFTTIKKDK